MLGEGQRIVLERVRAWLPPGMAVLLSADRCYPAAVLFGWRHSHGWPYRRRLKGKRLADPGYGDETTTGELAREVNECYLPGVQLFAAGVSTNLDIVPETGHEAPWLIAMACPPTRAAVLDYAARWAIEPTVADFKRREFALQNSPLDQAESSTQAKFAALEKNPQAQTDPHHWSFRKRYRSAVSWCNAGGVACSRGPGPGRV